MIPNLLEFVSKQPKSYQNLLESKVIIYSLLEQGIRLIGEMNYIYIRVLWRRKVIFWLFFKEYFWRRFTQQASSSFTRFQRNSTSYIYNFDECFAVKTQLYCLHWVTTLTLWRQIHHGYMIFFGLCLNWYLEFNPKTCFVQSVDWFTAHSSQYQLKWYNPCDWICTA